MANIVYKLEIVDESKRIYPMYHHKAELRKGDKLYIPQYGFAEVVEPMWTRHFGSGLGIQRVLVRKEVSFWKRFEDKIHRKSE